MSCDEITTIETLLILLAEVDGHLDVAQVFLEHSLLERASLEIEQAARASRRAKLLAMSIRWMDAPATLKNLVSKQTALLTKRYQER